MVTHLLPFALKSIFLHYLFMLDIPKYGLVDYLLHKHDHRVV
jgi:hypothetical protein